MGKKSKRKNKQSSKPTFSPGGGGGGDGRRLPPGLRNKEGEEEETLENLRFEDPYVDEIEQDEDVVMDDDDDEEEGYNDEYDDEDEENNGGTEIIQSWHPLMGTGTDAKSKEQPIALEMDPTAYKMHHSLTPEWPCLSFDFIKDELGTARTRFPHSLQVVVGTQADIPQNNSITVMKLSDLSKLPQDKETEEDILGEEYNPKKKNDDDDDASSSSSSDEEDIDLDPILEHYALPHYGGVNRLRVMPQSSGQIVATWADTGKVHLYNTQHVLSRFSASMGDSKPLSSISDEENKRKSKPFYTHSGHDMEGFAMDWSNVSRGTMCTGDCHGNIHLWSPRDENCSSYEVTPSYEASDYNEKVQKSKKKTLRPEEVSVEDIQWSPTEATVFATAECGGTIRIFDTRAPHRAMVSQLVHPQSKADVNVLSWNKLVTNLLATGGDDGTLSVWDLRHFAPSGAGGNAPSPKPLARFTAHKTPITSVEWHPTDESMLGVSDSVGAYVYDLSVEEDDTTTPTGMDSTNLGDIIPPQMLFAHAGSQEFKELHWHPQISSCMMTTALTGFSIFIPSNL